MKILSFLPNANPTSRALGFSFDDELKAAAKTALKPILKQLVAFHAKEATLTEACRQWSREAYAERMNDIRQRANNGDPEALDMIQGGRIPSQSAWDTMHGDTASELDMLRRSVGAALFRQALPLLAAAMPKVVERGQEVLDQTLKDFGLPPHELHGYRNHVSYTLRQVELAGLPAPADLAWFWSAVE